MQQCEQYRTISLITHACKILLHIIKERITPLIDNHMTDSQFGFRKSKGTLDAIFVLRMVGERMIQHQRESYITFIDYTKAFDRVNHEKLIKLLKDIGIPFHKTRLIANMYWNQGAKIRYGDEITECIKIGKGVHQGCVLSPILFNLYSEMLINEALCEIEGVKTIRYVDDTAVVAPSHVVLQRMMDKITRKCEEYGMSLNTKKNNGNEGYKRCT